MSMEDIELVIKISEDIYKDIIENGFIYDEDNEEVTDVIKNGTPLPKGHGELIDRDKIEYLKAIHDAKYGYITWGDASKLIKYSAPTIIEADNR